MKGLIVSSRMFVPMALVLIILLTCTSASSNDRLNVSGYFKSFSVAYGLPKLEIARLVPDNIAARYNRLPWLGSVSNRLRMQGTYRLSSWLKFNIAYDIAPRIQDGALFSSGAFMSQGIVSKPYRFDDLDSQLYPTPGRPVASFGIYQNLDRLQASIRTPHADIIIGRQAIAWGAARVVNPTDIIAPYAYGELDTEDCRGVDALRIRGQLGLMGEIDLGYVAGHNWEWNHSAAFMRIALNHSGYDFSTVVAAFRNNLLVGGDIAKSIGGSLTWVEVGYVWGKAPDNDTTTQNYLRMTLGADYSFSGKLYSFVEYHYNEAGFTHSLDYAQATRSVAYTEGGVYLLGRHYLIGGGAYQVTPLITTTTEVVYNASDQSAYLSPGMEYNIAEDIYLTIGGFIGLGESPLLEAGIFDLTPAYEFVRSEFGSSPDLLYLSFRTYF